MAPEEEWRTVPEYEHLYEVSSLGRVRSIRSGKVLKAHPGDGGYLKVNLYKDRQPRNCRVHVLVATSFIGAVPEGHEVHHEDEDRQNNALSNLTYLTESDHRRRHARSTGGILGRKGELSYRARLKDEDVRRIRSLFSQGWGVCRIAREYPGFHHSAIGLITRGKRWGHLAS